MPSEHQNATAYPFQQFAAEALPKKVDPTAASTKSEEVNLDPEQPSTVEDAVQDQTASTEAAVYDTTFTSFLSAQTRNGVNIFSYAYTAAINFFSRAFGLSS